MLATLDELEDHPYGYCRELVEIIVEKDELELFSHMKELYKESMDEDGKIKCEVYVLKNFQKEILNVEHLEKYQNSPDEYILPRDRDPDAPSYFYSIKQPGCYR